MLNLDKTIVIALDPEHLRNILSKDKATLDSIALASSTTVKNLRVIFDQTMFFNYHIKHVSDTYVILLTLGTSQKDEKNLSLHLLLPGKNIAILH